ncbi:DoxX family protein [Angustibacter sp. McL0619]|uniref:DoxX family protein n=1 Tax=Angustibacter sp. McL0619 TaxID=3415676 RepID=UPI003CE94476
MPTPGWKPLAVLLAASGVLHFAKPDPYARIVPKGLGDAHRWVAVSGAAELACAAGLASSRTRRGAALAAAGLFVAIFPANVQMAVAAWRSDRAGRGYQVGTLARLPLQAPLVAWALSVGRAARSAPSVRSSR